MTQATVVICTHDRAAVLGRAVEGALPEVRAGNAELLVVDNASTDGTPALLAGLERRHAPLLRVAREPRIGLSAARNRALAEARGEVVAFLDDDAIPRAGWLARLYAPYDDPRVACVGGRIRLRFESPPPPWLTPALHPALSAFDLGDAPRTVRYGEADYPYGANISFRGVDARAQGGFSTRVGLRGALQLQHEETDLCYRLERAGHEIRYAPDACVDHCIAADRLTPAWFLTRHWQGGRSAAVFVLRNRGLARALWRIRWLYARHLLARPYAPREPVDPARLLGECRRREALGYVTGLARALPEMRALRHDALARPALAVEGRV
jgi:glycosyltransferase involved in cell wall biosynthesis